MSSEIPVSQIAMKLLTMIVVMAVAFFGSAGTLVWPEAWLYVILQFSFSTCTAVWLKKHNPELLKERMTFCKSTARGWDKAILWVSRIVFVPYLLLPGLDAVRYHWSSVPLPIRLVSFVGIGASLALVFRVMRENPYLSRVVEIQKERGHQVITTGPYRYVRHPMYVGGIVLFFCIPIALGSFWTLIPSLALAMLVMVRTYFEDRMLHEELDGYEAYGKKTRYRLLPGVW